MRFQPKAPFLIALAGFLHLFIACESRPTPRMASAPSPSTQAPTWNAYLLGPLLIVEGEADGPMNLILESRSARSTFQAELGPVRWEMYAPPKGEVLTLKTDRGTVLGKWSFSEPVQAKPRSLPPRHSSTPRSVSRPEPKPLKVIPPALPPPSPPKVVVRMNPGKVPTIPPRAIPPAPLPDVRPSVNPPNLPPRPESWHLDRAWSGKGEGVHFVRGNRESRQLLLSFDGGSNAACAGEILDLLKARQLRTTFFLTGQFIRKNPQLVRRMVQEGHEVGNHTMTHPHFAPGLKRSSQWTRERVQSELLQADRAFYEVVKRPMDPYWRAPYGEQTAEIRKWAEEIGYRHIGWSEGADTLDWATPRERRLYRTGNAILKRLEQRLDRDAGGLIVLMHLGSERREEDRPSQGLGGFIDYALKQGWTLATAGELLRACGKSTWDPRTRLALLFPSAPFEQPGR